MKKLILVLFAAVVIMFSCSDDKMNRTKIAYGENVTTMATPKGGKLKAAENGPIRSALGQPQINLQKFELKVSGLVESPFNLSWDEIKTLEAVTTDTMLMYCVEGWEVWGVWKGILVSDLLNKAKLKLDAKYVLFHSADGYTTALPISYLKNYKSILTYEVNQKQLQAHDGFPLRLVAFGKFGYKWAKWINHLEVLDKSQLGYWEIYGFGDVADVPLDRRKYYEGPNAQPLEY